MKYKKINFLSNIKNKIKFLVYFLLAFLLNLNIISIAFSQTNSIAEWTILSYQAADNNLEANAISDINEMERIGPNPNINIIIQLDRPMYGYDDGVNNFKEAVRLKVEKDDDPVKISSKVLMSLGKNFNSGNPKALSDFIEWGIKNFPAKRYILVLWSHGSGWKTIPYDRINLASNGRSKSLQQIAKKPVYYYNNILDNPNLKYYKVPKIKTSNVNNKINELLLDIDKFNTRTIAYDDSSRSSIMLNDLGTAIKSGLTRANVNYFDIIWFDACLMGMAEVAFELKDCGKFMIASEEITPEYGWNHVKLLNAINSNYMISTSDMAKLIVNKFIESYTLTNSQTYDPSNDDVIELPVTMAALNLSYINQVVESLNNFVNSSKNPLFIPAIKETLNSVQRFDDADYIDLVHFLKLFENKIISPEMTQIISKLRTDIKRLILTCKTNSSHYRNANGISIYFPVSEYSELYDTLKFTKSNWNEFIKSYFKPLNSPILSHISTEIFNSNNDGRLSPNEKCEFHLKIANYGNADINNATFKLESSEPNIKIVSNLVNVETIKANSSAIIKFAVNTSNALKVNKIVKFNLYYTINNSEANIKLSEFNIKVLPPFNKSSNVLLVFSNKNDEIENAYKMSFNILNLNYDKWYMDSDGLISLQVLNKYKNGGVVFRIIPDSSLINKISQAEINVWEEFLKSYGSLCLTGQDIGAMIGDTSFYKTYLKCHFDKDDGGNIKLNGVGTFSEFSNIILNGPEAVSNQLFIDSIIPIDDSITIFKYDNNKIGAVLVTDKGYRLAYFAFGIESISYHSKRAEILNKILNVLAFNSNVAINTIKNSFNDNVTKSSNLANNFENILANISLTKQYIQDELDKSNYDAVYNLCLEIAKTNPSQRLAFKEIINYIKNTLKSKLLLQNITDENEINKINQILKLIE